MRLIAANIASVTPLIMDSISELLGVDAEASPIPNSAEAGRAIALLVSGSSYVISDNTALKGYIKSQNYKK